MGFPARSWSARFLLTVQSSKVTRAPIISFGRYKNASCTEVLHFGIDGNVGTQFSASLATCRRFDCRCLAGWSDDTGAERAANLYNTHSSYSPRRMAGIVIQSESR